MRSLLITAGTSLLCCFLCLLSVAQVPIDIDLKTKKYIGGVSDLDRARYFNMHHTHISWELNDNGADTELLDNLGAGYGRAFVGPGSGNPNTSGGKATSFPSSSEGTSIGVAKLDGWDNNPTFYSRQTDEIIVTDHPKLGFLYNGDFNAGAAYNSAYLQAAFSNKMPKYYEMMNEPFVHVSDFAPWSDRHLVINQMSNMWKTVADKIHQDIPSMKVGGYASAWPEMEDSNFGHWAERMQTFMDIAGGSMDFFSTHFYDGKNVTGTDQNRSGSNSEAIMDLIEAYSNKKWGVVKPHLISEYGKTVREWTKDASGNKDPKPYSESRDGEILKSVNGFLMQFLDKPDRMLKSVPFITGKSNFFYSSENPNQYPYPWVTLRKDSNGNYVWTHLKKFFELWKDVSGERVKINTGDPDIIGHAFVNGTKAYVTVYNMETANKAVSLNFLNNSAANINDVSIRRLFTDGSGIPNLTTTNQGLPGSLTLAGGETIVMVCNLNNTIITTGSINENNYYSTTVLEPIQANTDHVYAINGVSTGTGTAKLRLGLGRDHGLSLAPEVKVNGTNVSVPTDWMGYNQWNRNQFFGVIDIPFDASLLQTNNTITVKFSDAGGHISSLILNTEIDASSVTDLVSLENAATTLPGQTSYSVDLVYTANGNKELVLEFWNGGTWLDSDMKEVSSGSGTTTLTVNFASAPAPGSNYIWKAQIRPIGSSWQDATDTDQINNVIVQNLTDDVSLQNAPLSVESQNSYTVDLVYSANGSKELVLEFWDGGTWLDSDVQTVSSGSGTKTLTIELSSAPPAGTNYKWKAQIRPVGSGWQDATDTDQIDNVEVTVTPNQTPYGGTSWSIPGRVEAQNYDVGGEGVAYHDTGATNEGGAYRTDGVDIEVTGDTNGDYNIGWMNTGEWLEYTTNFTATQSYHFYTRVSSSNGSGQFKMLIDGVDVSGTKQVSNTGGWQVYETITIPNVSVSAGTHIVRIEVVNGGMNINFWSAWQSPGARVINQTLAGSDTSPALNIKAYPNPLNKRGKLYIDMELGMPTSVRMLVFGIDGSMLLEQAVPRLQSGSHTLELDTSMIQGRSSRGLYFLKILTDAGEQTVKLVN